MAVGTNEVQVDWGAGPSNSQSISSGGNDTSNTASLSATAVSRSIFLKADNDGTPAAGDTVDFYALFTGGDPDGASSDEFTTTGHAMFLVQLDTNTEDPALSAEIPIPHNATGLQVYAENNSAGRAITVSATVREKTVS